MKRAGAIVGAVLLVVGALALRGTFSSDDAGGGSSSGGGDDSEVTVACPTELSAACKSAFGDRAVVQRAGTTLDAIVDGSTGIDAWIVSRPWAEVASASAPIELDSVTVTDVSSPITIAIWNDRRAGVADDCGGEVSLKCLGDIAGSSRRDLGIEEGGTFDVGIDGLDTMGGFDVVAAGGSAFFGRADYASNDFDSAFENWLRAIQQDVGGVGDQYTRMLTAGRAAYAAYVGLEVELAPGAATARGADIELVTTPISSNLVVVDLAGGPDASGLATNNALIEALSTNGWRTTDAGDSPDGMATREGVLAALRTIAQRAS